MSAVHVVQVLTQTPPDKVPSQALLCISGVMIHRFRFEIHFLVCSTAREHTHAERTPGSWLTANPPAEWAFGRTVFSQTGGFDCLS